MKTSKHPQNTVAYQGIEGSFSFLAMQEYFKAERIDAGIKGLGQTKFQGIFEALDSAAAQYAIVPVENSLAGSVYDIYDLLLEYEVKVRGEHYLRVKHALLAAHEDHSRIKKVFSHPKALEQCQKYFESNPGIEKIFYSDTASAAKYVAESGDPSFAAIASREAAELYRLMLLKDNIEDDPSNYTRFLLLSKSGENDSFENDNRADKCSLIFSLPHKPKSLLTALEKISDERINISKIQSRPIQGKPFEYVFYIDFDFINSNLSFVKERLEDFNSAVNFLKILGIYKKSSLL